MADVSRVLRRSTAAIAVVVACLSGCSSTAPSAPPSTTTVVPSAGSPSATPDALASPSLDGSYAIDSEKRRLALSCWGSGTPAVVLDAGSLDSGLARWTSSDVVRRLAASATVCAYDRAGLGRSDPAPRGPRGLDDVARDLHLLLAAAGIARPVVMVGSSGGGFDVYHHAGRFRRDVAGLVMLDVPAGQRSMSHAGGPPEWSSPENPEHVDYYAEEHQMAVGRLPIGPIPVTVVTASAGQSVDTAEQRVWLAGSSLPRQVVLTGGHDIAADDPAGVAEQILAVVEASRQ